MKPPRHASTSTRLTLSTSTYPPQLKMLRVDINRPARKVFRTFPSTDHLVEAEASEIQSSEMTARDPGTYRHETDTYLQPISFKSQCVLSPVRSAIPSRSRRPSLGDTTTSSPFRLLSLSEKDSEIASPWARRVASLEQDAWRGRVALSEVVTDNSMDPDVGTDTWWAESFKMKSMKCNF
jgi:hypothetical protein